MSTVDPLADRRVNTGVEEEDLVSDPLEQLSEGEFFRAGFGTQGVEQVWEEVQILAAVSQLLDRWVVEEQWCALTAIC